MKSLLPAITLLATVPPVVGESVSFDPDAIGQPPAEWTCVTTGAGKQLWTGRGRHFSAEQTKRLRQSLHKRAVNEVPSTLWP